MRATRSPGHKVTRSQGHQVTRLVVIFCVFCLLAGCDAFVRKFTRKPKKEDIPKEEMVLAPEEYPEPKINRGELYRQYFSFWESWQDELISALLDRGGYKRRVGCVSEAVKNLAEARALLGAEGQKKLGVYVSRMKELQGLIAEDLYGRDNERNRRSAERIKMDVHKDFSYKKVAKDITRAD